MRAEFIHLIFSSADRRVPEGPIGDNTLVRTHADARVHAHARTQKTNKLNNSSLHMHLLFHSSTSPLSLIRVIIIASTESLTSKLGHLFTYLSSFAYHDADLPDHSVRGFLLRVLAGPCTRIGFKHAGFFFLLFSLGFFFFSFLDEGFTHEQICGQ